MIYVQVLSYRFVIMTSFLINDTSTSQISYNPNFAISLTTVYPLFQTFGKSCLGLSGETGGTSAGEYLARGVPDR